MMLPAFPRGGSAERWSSADVPASDRLEAWHPVLARTYARFDHLACEPGDLRLAVASRSVGGMSVATCTSNAGRGRRTPRVVRLDAERRFGVQVLLGGEEWMACGDNAVVLEPGSVVFWDSAMPSEFAVTAPIAKATVVFSEALLRERLPAGVALASTLIDGTRGIGALLRAHVATLAEQADSFAADDAGICNLTIDLLAAALPSAHALVPPRTHGALRKLERIQASIRARLGEPDLSPATIASDNGISVRYLHLLFHAGGTTVAAWVKEQRLLGCRDELVAPAYACAAVAEIALRHGFADAANFSREFKRRFGCNPSSLRPPLAR